MKSQANLEGRDLIKLTDFIRAFIAFVPQIPRAIIELKKFLSLPDSSQLTLGWQLEQNAKLYPHSDALVYEDKTWTHDDFNQITNRYARFFLSKGIRKGNYIAVFLENQPELLFVIGALAKIGAVAALINPQLTGRSLLHCFKLEDYTAYVIDEKLTENFSEISNGFEQQNQTFIFFTNRNEYKDFDASDLVERAKVTIKDPYALVFTSGTTGLPKASIQTNRRWFGAMTWFGKIVLRLTHDHRLYIPLPFCHTNALQAAWAPASGAGASVIMRKKFSTSQFWDDVYKYRASHFIYIGEVCRYLTKQSDHPLQRKHQLQAVFGNGLRPEIWNEFKDRFKISKIYEFYGAAEAPLIFTNIFNLNKTVGICMTPYAVVRYDHSKEEIIRNANGFCDRIKKGETGLLLAQINPQTPFSGYTKSEETEKKLLRNIFRKGDLFFNSGDLVKNLGFRHIAFMDRLGDTFRWKGENIATSEVERIANIFSGVKESSCYGVSFPGHDGKVGALAIVIEGEAENFDIDKFYAHLRSELPSYSVPRFLRFCSSFETTGTHKIIKRHLQDEGLKFVTREAKLFWYNPRSSTIRVLTESPSESDLRELN